MINTPTAFIEDADGKFRPMSSRASTITSRNWSQESWPPLRLGHDPGALNVYLIDTAAGANLPDNVGRLRATLGRLRGTLLALPRERMILVDADYLAKVKAAADLSWASTSRAERLVSHFDALAATQVDGRTPRCGPAGLRPTGAVAPTNCRGAAAFRMRMTWRTFCGLDSALEGPVRRPPGLQGRDADRFWACSNLVGEKITGTRQQEADADQYAALQQAMIAHPSRPKTLRFSSERCFFSTPSWARRS